MPKKTTIAAKATLSEKERATELLAEIVAPGTSNKKAFAALDEAFAMIERIRRRV